MRRTANCGDLTCEEAHRLERRFGVTYTEMQKAIDRNDATARRYAEAIREVRANR